MRGESILHSCEASRQAVIDPVSVEAQPYHIILPKIVHFVLWREV